MTVAALVFLAGWWANHFRRTRRNRRLTPERTPAPARARARTDRVSEAIADEGRGRAGLARSSAAVAAGTLLSRVTGLLRVVVLAAAIGKASLADTYNLANITPNIVYELLVGGVLAATLVPVFVDLFERRDDRSTSAVFTVTMTALTLFTAVTMLLSPLLARLFVLARARPRSRARNCTS